MTKAKDLSKLFATDGGNKAEGSRSLNKTGQLTSLAESIANDILKATTDEHEAEIKQTMVDHNAMDRFINKMTSLDKADISFLKDVSEDELDKMIKSQQSKRSRSKGKTMTLDNYMSLMTGAIAELLLREAAGKPKDSSALGARKKDVSYSDEELAELAEDQEALNKAIRNIQSKKSIAKSKADFDESSERWQQLLTAERKLKALRTDSNPLAQALASVDDVDNMSAEDAKELLKKLNQLNK